MDTTRTCTLLTRWQSACTPERRVHRPRLFGLLGGLLAMVAAVLMGGCGERWVKNSRITQLCEWRPIACCARS
jgi:hypothetical protein